MIQTLSVMINALGWTFLHAMWQGALVGLLFVLSRSVLGSASPAIRHANALTWLVLFVSLPLFTFVALLATSTGASAVSVVPAMLPAIHIAQWPAESPGFFPGMLSLVGCLWLSGIIVLSVRLFGEWRTLERHTCSGSRPIPQLEESFAELRQAMRVHIPVRLVEAVNATVPMVVGFIRPVIVLPSSALLGLTPRELELIIAHELGHLRRKDHLINYLLIVAETLLFFHPVVYTLTRTIRHERELCCDDLVITTFNERVCYAHALSKLEIMRGSESVSSTSLRLAAADGPLVTRIARMVSGRTHRRWGVMPAAMLPFVAAAFAFSGFHLAHLASGQKDDRKTLPASASPESGERSASNVQNVGDDPVEEVQLHPVDIGDYPRRRVAASAVSRITLALTQTDAQQPLGAIERGETVSRSARRAPDAGSISAGGRSATHRPENELTLTATETGNAARQSQNPLAPRYAANTGVRAVPSAMNADGGSLNQSHAPAESGSEHTTPAGIGGVKVAYIPTETNVQYPPFSRQAGLPSLPSYRPELSNSGAELMAEEVVKLSNIDEGDLVETGGALIHRVTPRYPTRARSRGLIDKVIVSIDVDANGKVNSVSVINRDSRPMFQRSVMRAVTQWQFEPLLRNGVPVERTVEQSFDFRLEPFTAKRRSSSCRDTQSYCRLST